VSLSGAFLPAIPPVVQAVERDPEQDELRFGLLLGHFAGTLVPGERAMHPDLPVLVDIVGLLLEQFEPGS
jgi:hypothetical protein